MAAGWDVHGQSLGLTCHRSVARDAPAVHHQPEALQVLVEHACAPCKIRAGSEWYGRVVGVEEPVEYKAQCPRQLSADASAMSRVVHRGEELGHVDARLLEPWEQRLEGRLHDEEEQHWREGVSLLDAHLGLDNPLNVLNGEGSTHVRVEHFDLVHEVLRDTKAQEDVEEEGSVNGIKGFHQIHKQHPCVQAVFSAFLQGHLEHEAAVRSATAPHEAALLL